MILALLIKSPSDDAAWDGFPPVGSRSQIGDDWSHDVYHTHHYADHQLAMKSCHVAYAARRAPSSSLA